MKIGRVDRATRVLGAPKDWDQTKGECGGLPVRIEQGAQPGYLKFTSAWVPDVADLAALEAGAAIMLDIHGSMHPPVAVYVGSAPTDNDAPSPIFSHREVDAKLNLFCRLANEIGGQALLRRLDDLGVFGLVQSGLRTCAAPDMALPTSARSRDDGEPA